MNNLDMSQQPVNGSCIVVNCDNDTQLPVTTLQTMEPTMSSQPSPSPSYPEKVIIGSARLKFSTHIKVQIKTLDTGSQHDLVGLLDSGATGFFLSTSFVERNNLNTRKLSRAVPVYNVDGSLNHGGSITQEVDVIMTYKGHVENATFAVCDLGEKDAVVKPRSDRTEGDQE